METLTPHQAAASGMSASGLYRAARQGRFDRIARGIYRDAAAPAADWGWIEAAARRADATVCLISALAHYDLTDDIPNALDIAIPRGSRIPAGNPALAWHLFDRRTFDLGRTEIEIPGSTTTIGIYSPERCIADVFRLRGDVGYETGRDALRVWLRRGGQPGRLMEIASQLPRTSGPLRTALEILA
ncbi:MAG: type IV toxin-antitoxin system AbiEi family antitoxin domain-containing protein [Sporichthyaceae bacterium]